MFPYPIPAPTAPFRPRADAGVFAALVDAAWREQNDTLAAAAPDIGEAAAALLRAFAPASDLGVLRRYGFTKTADEISVRIYDGKDYSNTYWLKLPEKIEWPSSLSGLVACAPRWSRDPMRGCKAEYWNGLSEAEQADLVAYQDKDERRQLPDACEPFFHRLVTARAAYKAEYRRSCDWPEEFKTQHGRWPTWAEIADALPTLGAFIKSATKDAA